MEEGKRIGTYEFRIGSHSDHVKSKVTCASTIYAHGELWLSDTCHCSNELLDSTKSTLKLNLSSLPDFLILGVRITNNDSIPLAFMHSSLESLYPSATQPLASKQVGFSLNVHWTDNVAPEFERSTDGATLRQAITAVNHDSNDDWFANVRSFSDTMLEFQVDIRHLKYVKSELKSFRLSVQYHLDTSTSNKARFFIGDLSSDSIHVEIIQK